MSMTYWMIEGVGIEMSKVKDHIDSRKLAEKLHEMLPEDAELTDIIRTEDYARVDIGNYLQRTFDNLAELFTHCDDTDTLTCGDDNDGQEFLYYPPSMPWEQTENEPKDLKETHRRIVHAVQALTTLSEAEIESMIDDDIYAIGFG